MACKNFRRSLHRIDLNLELGLRLICQKKQQLREKNIYILDKRKTMPGEAAVDSTGLEEGYKKL